MFRYNRIIVVIVFFLMLFGSSSCDKKRSNSFLGISKVEVTCNLYSEAPHLEIYLFSSTDYDEITVKKNNLIKNVSGYHNDIILIKDGNKIPGFLHLFYIEFERQEFILQNLVFLSNNKEIECSIGMYQTLILEPSTIDIDTTINIYQDKDLTALFTIHNKLYNSIFLLEQRVVSIRKHQLYEPYVIDKLMVNPKGMKSLDIFSINPKEKYHQIGGIVQSRFKTNLDEHIIYTSYYYSNMMSLNYLSTTGIDVSLLEEIKNS